MFTKMGSLGDLTELITKAKEFHSRMEEVQEELHSIVLTAEAGAGMVRASVTAKGELVKIEIDPTIFNSDEREVVEDLIVAAVKSAQAKAAERSESEISKLTDEVGFPEGLSKMPF